MAIQVDEVKRQGGTKSARNKGKTPGEASGRLRRTISNLLPPLLLFVFIVLVWQFVVPILGLQSFILPTPTEVIHAATSNFGNLMIEVWSTFKESVAGFLISVVVGVLLGLLMSQSKMIERSLYPYAILMQTIPVVAIAPLVVIWFGPGFLSIVSISFVVAVFPVISNVTAGLTSTDHRLLDLFDLYKVSRLRRFTKLQMPYALPFVMTGLKISSGLSVIGAIVGEFVAGMGGGQGGLGYAILSSGVQLQTAYLFACALAAACMGILIFLVVNWVAGLLLGHWHETYVKRG